MKTPFDKYLTYRDKSYFSEGETYLMKTSYGLRVTSITDGKPKAWAKNSLSEYMDTVQCVNVSELKGILVTLKDHNDCVGRISTRSLPNTNSVDGISGYLSIFWDKISRTVGNYSWNDPNTLRLMNEN